MLKATLSALRAGLRPGEAGAILRFAVVGGAATLSYLGASLLLLDVGAAPQAANLVGFLVGVACSYLGHYFFTYRSRDPHLTMGSRFVAVTAALTLLSAGLHHLLLVIGAAPLTAAVVIALTYPPLSFAGNHFWAFYRGDRAGRRQAAAGKQGGA